jgi:pSer/pThr/pTyr-binding forkhead associated (FHA) protein
MRARLIPLDGGPPVEITKDLMLVGRKENCDLRLEHKSVSKLHCVIVRTDGLLILRDLGSTNGTRVNGQRVRRAALLPDDHLTIAAFKFRVHLGPSGISYQVQDRTEHLDPSEVARLLRQTGLDAPRTAAADAAGPPLQPNPLPDVYTEREGEDVDSR